MEIIIIGGGISGLYLAHLLSEKNCKIVLYEKENRFGGRMKTVYSNKKEKVLYESGPWRIHHSHKRVERLFSKLGATFKAIDQKKNYFSFATLSSTFMSSPSTIQTNQITEYQHDILSSNIPCANQKMAKTGYDNIYQQAYGTESYHVPDTIKNKNFYVIEEGFSWCVEQLVQQLKKKKNVSLHLDSKINNVNFKNKKFYLEIAKRDERKNNSFSFHQTQCKILIMAVPPSEMKLWDISKIHIGPNIYCVDSLPLMHIMACSPNISQKPFKYIVNNPLSQIVSTCFQNSWFQISYSAGRMAMLWENLRLIKNTVFHKQLLFYFHKYFPSNTTISKIVPHFWRHAVHYWLPNRKLSKVKLSHACIHPHSKKIPNLFWIGEAISTHQGWMEGALETAEHVFHQISLEPVSQKNPIKKKLPKEYVIYDGRILNVEEWKHVHPGSIAAIENHMYQDITNLWNQYHPKEASKYFIGLEHSK